MSSNSDKKSVYDDIHHILLREYDEEISNKVMKKLQKNLKKLTQQNSNIHNDNKKQKIEKITKRKFTKQEREKLRNDVIHDICSEFEGLKIKLFSHQKNSIIDMIKREVYPKLLIDIEGDIQGDYYYRSLSLYTPGKYKIETNISILGNEPGSGKTLTILGLISQDYYIKKCFPKLDKFQEEKGIDRLQWKYITRNVHHDESTSVTIESKYKYIYSNLIIVPHGGVFRQWKKAIQEQTHLNAQFIEKNNDFQNFVDINDCNDIEIIKRFCNILKKNKTEIVLVSSTFFCKFMDRYKIVSEMLYWHRVIIDEGDSIRCPDMRQIRYRFAWFVTATWESLKQPRCNGLIKNIFKNYPINFTKRLVIERNEEFYKELFSNVNIQNIDYRCLAPIAYISQISHIISPNVLEMINANNLNGAIRELGGRVGSGQEISEVLTANIRRRLERLNYDRTYVSESPYITDNDKVRRLTRIDTEINSLQSQLDSITNRINNLNNEECVICCCSYTEPVCLDCTHIFCSQCILKWIEVRTRVHQRAQCPYCKRIINVANMHKIDINAKNKEKKKEENSEEKNKEIFGKDETIIKIIENNPDGKFIIFSNHYESFDSFENLLTRNRNIQKKCKRLVGNTNTIAKTLRNFENGRLDIILLNSQYNGAGIDLPTATHVILYHKMRKDLEKQVIGRALRIGRPKSLPLFIHRLKYDNEYNNN
ncbi:uncharacterized protein METZ01_LOCUS116548 [marine metagenome]|uniref:RING-type domain-containing protein n=1 Tax=marine metagenome TaxID=408172 RepID=A0A381XG00_9ZZZZ